MPVVQRPRPRPRLAPEVVAPRSVEKPPAKKRKKKAPARDAPTAD